MENSSISKFIYFSKSSYSLAYSFFHILLSWLNPFSAHVLYFISLSLVGFVAMKVPNPNNISDFDLFFTSVSAVTVSSMSTVEMEVFSNPQLLIITVLMLVGGEVFTSMIGLHFMKFKFKKYNRKGVDTVGSDPESLQSEISLSGVELGLVNHPDVDRSQKPNISLELGTVSFGNEDLKYESIRCLTFLVLCYLLTIHIFGSTLVLIYVNIFSSARQVLEKKGLHLHTFSIFLTVSTFANCGFTPTKENMIVFSKNPGLLLILIPLILLGNTLFAPCLHFLTWVLVKFTKREEFGYLLKNHRQVGYAHLLSKLHCLSIVTTALGFILVQLIIFCSLEWNSETMEGLNSYEKLVGSLFQVVNSRHAGESVVDISLISPAILVLFVVMMYLPPYASFCPIEESIKDSTNETKFTIEKNKFMDYNTLFPQLSYIVIFIILICLAEREKMKSDPLNFNVISITLEVVSAYGNVGFSTGYSCKRQLKYDSQCRDAPYGLVGKWSEKGKIILIIVMLFGRLKNFTKGGGKAWKL